MVDRKKQTTKVNQLRPLDTGINVTVKVVDAKTVQQRGKTQGRFADCLVGDDTGMIILTARNNQVDLAKDGNTLILSNAKIDIQDGCCKPLMEKVPQLISASCFLFFCGRSTRMFIQTHAQLILKS